VKEDFVSKTAQLIEEAKNQFQNRDTKSMHLRFGLMSLAQTRKTDRRNLRKKEE